MEKEDFVITQDRKNDAIRFRVKGRVNSSNADTLEYKLQGALKDGEKKIILNMMEVLYLSSIGIRVILKIYKEALKSQGIFKIEAPSENVKNVLGLTALDELLLK